MNKQALSLGEPRVSGSIPPLLSPRTEQLHPSSSSGASGHRVRDKAHEHDLSDDDHHSRTVSLTEVSVGLDGSDVVW